MDRPKVVRVISYLTVGGVEKRLLAVLKELQGEFDCQVVCIHSRGPLAEQFEKAGIPVVTIPFKGRFHPISLLKLALFLRRNGVQIVHSHMYRPNASATVAALLAQVPVRIANVHNLQHWDNRRQKLTDALLHPFRTHTITVSWQVWREYLEEIKAYPEKTSVIHNGILLGEENGSAQSLFKELGIPPKAQVVSCVARLVPQKGHRTLLEAWAEVEKRTSNPWLLIVGGGPLEEELKRQAKGLGLERVVFAGVRYEVDAILKASCCTVLPSLKEGFSNVILEAMAAATPAVVTAVGGAEEAMVHGETGILVEAGDPQGFVKPLLNLVSNPGLAKRMGLQARERQQRLFTLKAMAEKTSKLYKGF